MVTTLADRFLPDPDFAEVHQITVGVPPEVAWAAHRAGNVTFGRPARALIAARGLIARARNGRAQSDLPTGPGAFVTLAEEPPREIVQGLVGQWWRFGASANRAEIDGPERFLDFAEPGYGKAVFCLRFLPSGEGTRIVTETRVTCTDAASRRAMGRYWPLIRPFSGLIRIMLLRDLAARARRLAATGGARAR
ncbi:hypothetical protein ACSNOI_11525 [Actinomadura kijaniata]|uniref:hypothetical protein n=1 Tax=Actinomadura kijaniata TaxID=46161 RepID=UPI003F1D81E6